jgi:hypothetical protein
MKKMQATSKRLLVTKFLEERKLLEKFEEEYNKSNWNKVKLRTYFHSENEYYVIILSFNFHETDEGFHFWYKIAQEWDDYLTQHKELYYKE